MAEIKIGGAWDELFFRKNGINIVVSKKLRHGEQMTKDVMLAQLVPTAMIPE